MRFLVGLTVPYPYLTLDSTTLTPRAVPLGSSAFVFYNWRTWFLPPQTFVPIFPPLPSKLLLDRAQPH